MAQFSVLGLGDSSSEREAGSSEVCAGPMPVKVVILEREARRGLFWKFVMAEVEEEEEEENGLRDWWDDLDLEIWIM